MAKAKRNGEIELLRFIFSLIIMCYHINNQLEIVVDEPFSFFMNGKIGVEFFFIVSGYLMAASAKRRYDTNDIVHDTGVFVKKKFWSIFPYHIICFTIGEVIVMLFTNFKDSMDALNRFIISFPNLFLIQNTGLTERNVLTPEWYISAMLWMMLILYPLILHFQDKFTKFAAPVICVVLIGYMIYDNGKLGGTSRFALNDTIPKNFVRAFSEMSGGVFGYEVVQATRGIKWKMPTRILLTLAETLCFALPIVYCFSDWKMSYEGYAYYFLLAGVLLAFSEVSVFSKLYNNKVIYYLGRMSLPIYYTHRLPILTYRIPAISEMPQERIILYTIVTALILAVLIEPVANLMMKPINKKLEKLHTPKAVMQ